MNRFIFTVLSFLFMISCDQYREFISERDYTATVTDSFKYDLLNPNEKYFMNYSLEEISGLSYVSKNLLACVQDEGGKLYLYDTEKRTVSRRIKFHKGGDYEGVEILDRTAYVVESNGDIFRFSIDGNDKQKAEKIETPLKSKNNVEGLSFDPSNNHLLLLCKEDAGIDDEIKGRAVYKFDPIEDKFYKKPLIVISNKEIERFLEKEGRKERDISFQPSGIAVHPIENRYYIIASNGKALIVLSEDLIVEEFIRLRPAVLTQPEGICFGPNGDLYIASEGNGEDGYILKFNY